MILLADSGGTKVDWCLLDSGDVVDRFSTPGLHALMLTPQEMRTRIADEVALPLSKYVDQISEVYFYGAGCVSGQVCSSMNDAISANFKCAVIEVTTDMLGTARALCGDRPGIVCILGTGSNSCFYDGKMIVENVSPLGYILGDEGSGAYLGKMLIGDVLKLQLPPEICQKFLSEYDLNAVKVVQHVYREPNANRFLASFTPFLRANIHEPSIRGLVINGFKAFFERNVCLYKKHTSCKVYCSGSVGFVFKDLFIEAAAWAGFSVGGLIRTPMEGLIKYHSEK